MLIQKLLSRVWPGETIDLRTLQGGAAVIVAMILANGLNFLTSLLAGQKLDLQEFGQYSSFLSLFYLLSIFYSALSLTIMVKTSQIISRHNLSSARNLWLHHQRRGVLFGVSTIIIFLISATFLSTMLHLGSPLLLISFTPLIVTHLLLAINEGYLTGRLAFSLHAAILITEASVRFLVTLLLILFSFEEFIILSVPMASLCALVVSYFLARPGKSGPTRIRHLRLSPHFFTLALLSRFSTAAFFSLDQLIVAHFFDDISVGIYGLLSVLGKMIFFASSLLLYFMLPLTTHRIGRKAATYDVFMKLMTATLILCAISYIGVGLGLPLIAPLALGYKTNALNQYLPLYGLGVVSFVVSQVFVQYHMAKKRFMFAALTFLMIISSMISIWLYHPSLLAVIRILTLHNLINLAVLTLMHVHYHKLKWVWSNMTDLVEISSTATLQDTATHSPNSLHVLIFNWRDIRHIWGGGAETYIHEIAKGLVSNGHAVTVFCANDGHNPRNETIDGVNIIRRGGSFTVYIWAMIYYLTVFRKYVDCVIDSENGIPFLTPFYVRKPITLLIHHVHQNVFREHLPFLFSELAAWVEGDVMTFLYRNTDIITVSGSSKRDILGLGLGTPSTVDIINPGVHLENFAPQKKTKDPSVVYVGRIKKYKNIQVVLHAFSKIVDKFPKARFTIGGTGDAVPELKKLVKQLGISDSVSFLGKVSEEEKVSLFAQSWVAVQPSTIEGWGITVIEANACGTPVVASNVEGLRDSVKNHQTGLLVSPYRADAFYRALHHLFEDKNLRKRMSAEALVWAQRFSWNRSIDKINKIILHQTKTAHLRIKSHSRLKVSHES
jgi:glycosyltransferase involved in cell wall biosynthesis/O-antigen/teichoic acid export membrane protein